MVGDLGKCSWIYYLERELAAMAAPAAQPPRLVREPLLTNGRNMISLSVEIDIA
ncbi:hypothetical protein I6F30_11085 [Bradyrhizobium sp. NBAIM20]|uniref:hypothetical protein n=1 Tax=unclassified Bradyrhizobium TaxID=2631580 RepID=UPI001CD2B3C0|nr:MULTISPECIES: hypothetical protein [unclassified Bradyrhizobium]MCA1411686.1 hypothetical protein [Bradyrhizobium sp. NBAIM20]MCA1460979.1 hypothetical protein [Bradyrhizobium sp. NBAIM18]